jgi:hypothetical protein
MEFPKSQASIFTYWEMFFLSDVRMAISSMTREAIVNYTQYNSIVNCVEVYGKCCAHSEGMCVDGPAGALVGRMVPPLGPSELGRL